MLNGKSMTGILIAGLIKKILLYKNELIPPSHSYSKNKTEVELDLSNYLPKSDSKNTAGVNS